MISGIAVDLGCSVDGERKNNVEGKKRAHNEEGLIRSIAGLCETEVEDRQIPISDQIDNTFVVVVGVVLLLLLVLVFVLVFV